MKSVRAKGAVLVLLVAAGGGWFWTSRQHAPPGNLPSAAVPASENRAGAAFPDWLQRSSQDRTEARLRELEAKVAAVASSTAATPLPTPAQAPASEEDTAAARAAHLKDHEQAIDRHWKEPDDPSWARPIEKKLEKEFDEVGANAGFSLVKTDCRTESCVAVTEWPSYGSAMQNWMSVITHRYNVNCGVEVMLQEPTNAAARYQTTVVFSCDPSQRQM